MTAETASEHIRKLEAELRKERQIRLKAEAEMHAKSELLATVSDEMRTPMGAIISMVDLLLTSELSSTQHHYVKTLKQSTSGLLAVLNDILDYSKIGAGQFMLENIPFNLEELMDGMGLTLKTQADKKGLISAVENLVETPVWVIGDPVRIRQIFNNLIDNAVKFTDSGSIRIILEKQKASGKKVNLRFSVLDTGRGLSEGQKEHLFGPPQASSSSAVNYEGMGLGLSMARELSALMGGTLDCKSLEGGGSHFWFTISVEETECPRQTPNPSKNAAVEVPAYQILVVEDNHVNQMLIAAYLDKFGFNYEMADNGTIAIHMVAQSDYDLVLMDIMMPGIDGIEATKQIRSLEGSGTSIPIIALTANAMKGDRESYLAAGMNDYISKPINAQNLFLTMMNLLEPVDSDAKVSV